LTVTAFDYLRTRAESSPGYELVRANAATEVELRACEEAIGSKLPRSLRECLAASNGFELSASEASFLRVYSTAEIVSSTVESRQFWVRPHGTSPWGDFIEIARSENAESTYAVHPPVSADETPLYEIWPDGPHAWQTDPPLAPTFGDWLIAIADAMASGDPERVYDTLWLGPAKDASP
jgi:hypothetical protein